jgi:transporter family protein
MSQLRGQLEAILSSLCFGIAPIFAKKGLMSGLNPFYGVAIANATALVVTIFFTFLSGQGSQLKSIKRYGLFLAILAGISNTIAIFSLYWAMSTGRVALVVPITCIYPLFTMSVAYLFMKESEGIDIFTVIGTFLIIIGVILLSI